ncbi:fibronectin type III domain-containing protein [Budvicia diplopodorum]|uniref:fibronectin type III domain-containing protein n=1 Tax=Budvicia diplopodorum TaxID=1119056 RepID=UPI0013581B02|nr:fibronectin type III domain-containing protein [Budvicia diplopodorum]
MQDSNSTAFVYSAWVSGGDEWYSECQLTIYNTDVNDLIDPEISFTVDASQSISDDVNFSFTRTGTTITGHLTETSTVPAGGSVICKIGVANNSGISIGNLPSDFFINGVSADVPEDHVAPTTPQNLQATEIGAQTLSVSWEPSTDNVMVAGYLVEYSATGIEPITVQVSTNSINISNLTPETVWTISVVAFDLSNNESATSIPLQVETSSALPDPGPCSFSGAPFIDYAAWPTPQCSKFGSESGIKNYILGFLTSAQTADGPRPCWGGQTSMTDSNDNVTYPGDATISDYGKSDIAAFRAIGGDVAISFGGAAGTVIEEDITDIPTLVGLYQAVIENYQLTMIDFDFEGATLQLLEVLQRHVSVIGQIQAQNPTLKISYTLPVDGQTDFASQGLTNFGTTFLSMLGSAGLSPSMINGMTMDFGATNPPPDVYTGCVYALNALHNQIAAVYPHWDSAQIWRRMGATPMFGYNDNGTDFTPANQQQLLEFAQSNNLGCLSGWDATRDYNQGLDKCNTGEQTSLYECTYEGDEPYIYTSIIANYQHS